MVEQFGSLNLAAEDGGIVSDVQARHGHSAQPESQQVMAVMRAVLEVIAAQGLSPSPTAIFAAIMSALEKPETQGSAQVVAAMSTLLDLTLPRVPNAVLRSKFNSCCQIITSVLQQHSSQVRPAGPASFSSRTYP
jgi:ribosomal RNA-processing protein 12